MTDREYLRGRNNIQTCINIYTVLSMFIPYIMFIAFGSIYEREMENGLLRCVPNNEITRAVDIATTKLWSLYFETTNINSYFCSLKSLYAYNVLHFSFSTVVYILSIVVNRETASSHLTLHPLDKRFLTGTLVLTSISVGLLYAGPPLGFAFVDEKGSRAMIAACGFMVLLTISNIPVARIIAHCFGLFLTQR